MHERGNDKRDALVEAESPQRARRDLAKVSLLKGNGFTLRCA